MRFDTVLIANRGEIACRIVRTARALGYRTVAVFSDADADARHVQLADLAVALVGTSAAESYLSIDKLIDAARKTGAGAIHPGYGFLAENARFAAACESAGIVFVGPPASAIELMGSKRISKERMIAAGVPCVPGYIGAAQDEATLIAEAKKIGMPLLIKASAGGGGKGLRLVEDDKRLADQIRLARSEAENSFGDGELILERAIVEPRHVEIQVFADMHGGCIHLGERDCSVQRRHQKVIEESPSPAVTPELRAKMGATAVEAAKAIGYVGAGTIEFLLDASGHFYFMEMNTRLQVEHPVTELITGVDLVAWQLDVAQGKPLPITQGDLQTQGCAIEVRLYAEDPAAGYLPQTGRAERIAWPENVRVDHGLVEGAAITAHYDPMLAKVIAHGRDRDEARRKLIRALEETAILGVVTNQSFLIDVLRHPVFAAGAATTAFLGQHFAQISRRIADPATVALAAVLACTRGQTSFWRSSGAAPIPIKFARGEEELRLTVTPDTGSFRVGGPGLGSDYWPDFERTVRILDRGTSAVRVECDGIRWVAHAWIGGDAIHVSLAGRSETFRIASHSKAAQAGPGDGTLLAPMAGKIVDVRVKTGERVERGQLLIVLEAMKMQLELTAKSSGTVQSVLVSAGEQVDVRQVLASIAVEDP
jgi:geranyl-CoA carboxylase alpha subunit